MAVWGVALDPAAVTEGRTELNLNSGAIQADRAGIDWGDAAVKQYLAEARYGEPSTSYRVPNRTITIPLALGMGNFTVTQEEKARRELQQKVGLIQRQQGVLLRQREGGPPFYADIVDASLTIPDVWGEGGAIEPGVVLKLICLPDFYGESLELEAITGSGQAVGVLQAAKANAVIPGDYPARARIVLTETSNHVQKGVVWGLRQRFYSSAAKGHLFYDAKEMTPLNGAKETVVGGTYSGKGVEFKPVTSAWFPFLSTDIGTGPIEHLGSYRVWARIKGPAGTASVRLSWSTDNATTSTINAAATIREGFNIVDLGEIRLEEPPVGTHWWRGILQVFCTTEATMYADRIWFQPIDDGAGRLRATAVPPSTTISVGKLPTKGENNATIQAGTAWAQPEFATAGHPGKQANITFAEKAKSQALLLTKLGFAIPTEATIRGIGVSFANTTELHSGEGGFSWVGKAWLVKGTTILGTKTSVFQPSEPLGSPSDTWGHAWTPAEINEATVGLALGIEVTAYSGLITTIATGAPTVTVYFTLGGSAPPEDAVLYAERKTEIRFDGAVREDASTEAYTGVSDVQGDLVRLPPGGLEAAPIELFVKQSRGKLSQEVGAEADEAIDSISAKVIYRPCYIGRL